MRQSDLLRSILPLLCGMLMLSNQVASAQSKTSPQSFYVVTHFFSDYLLDSFEDIMEVTPQGKDVLVRVFRLSNPNHYCSGELVRATERILPDTTVRKVAGKVDLCSHSQQGVTAALKAAAPKGREAIFDSATLGIVAECGGEEKVFKFPYPEEVDLKVLDKNSPRVSALWNMTYRVRKHAFGENFTFNNLPAAQEKEFEDLGTKLLPELISGKFNAGFGYPSCANQNCDTNYLARRLKGYTGPPSIREPGSVRLINASSLHLEKYALPRFPPLAMIAHISGEVHLKVLPDARTGLVKDVQLLSGHPMLAEVASKAARDWQFSPGAQSEEPVEAVLKFELCSD